jgi:hypothetical protein
MNKKTDKVMAAVKSRHQQKEQKKLPGSEGSFNPVHPKSGDREAPESPNQYMHVKEALAQSGTSNSLGGRHKPRKNFFKSTLGNPKARQDVFGNGNQSQTDARGRPNRYTEEEVEIKNKVLKKVRRMKEEQGAERTDNLGRPDTGGTQDTVTVNPKKQELTGQLK